tara:strand:+ start:1053 stop:1787 length:735 start_codon:yes stop_codon:yes gene_type:complete
MGAFLTTTISAVKYYEGAENTTRFNYKLSGANERDQTYKRWWKEQIRLYGTEIDYYVRNFTLSATDKVYGENTHQGYHPKSTFVMLMNLTDGSLTYSQYGLVSDDEIDAVIDIETFQQSVSSYIGSVSASLPKAGDAFQLTEFGSIDRPGGKDGKIFEVTERMDEMIGEINQLQGHYVFKLKARRNDHTFLPGLTAEAGSTMVTDTSGVGPLSAIETDYINDLDTEQSTYFDYGTNDDVYGDYY